MKIGYARISTQDQKLNLQTDALEKAGCEKIFTDTASGAKDDRIGLIEAVEFCRSGDSLVVWKLDRLGRSLKHLIETINLLHKKKVGFVSLQESIDTTSSARLPNSSAKLFVTEQKPDSLRLARAADSAADHNRLIKDRFRWRRNYWLTRTTTSKRFASNSKSRAQLFTALARQNNLPINRDLVVRTNQIRFRAFFVKILFLLPTFVRAREFLSSFAEFFRSISPWREIMPRTDSQKLALESFAAASAV